MIDHTTALYCIVDDLLKAIWHEGDCRRVMTDAEVLTTALLAAHCFGGNAEHARRWSSLRRRRAWQGGIVNPPRNPGKGFGNFQFVGVISKRHFNVVL